MVVAACALSSESVFGLPVFLVDGRGARAERRYPFPVADSVNIDRDEDVIIVRSAGHVYAFNLSCPHEHAAVKWVEKDHRFQCTKHDSRYQPDGEHISGRATRNMDRFPVRRDGAQLVVNLDKMIQSDKDPSGWSAATIAASAPAPTEKA